MADRYIDQDEIQIYGTYAVRRIRRAVVGLVPALDGGLNYLATELEDATGAVKTAVEAARTADVELRKHTGEKTPALAAAIGLLGRFSRHLEGHDEGAIDRKEFFTRDGTAGGVGRTAPRVVLALAHISTRLKAKDSPVRDREAWHKDFADAARRLGGSVEHSDNARTERHGLTPEVDAAREAWLQLYAAAKSGVECALRLTGRLDRLATIFHDLMVSPGAKVTDAPAEPADDPPPHAPTP